MSDGGGTDVEVDVPAVGSSGSMASSTVMSMSSISARAVRAAPPAAMASSGRVRSSGYR